MPDWLQVILLGVIEGITEFLPVSSTGHLLLAEQWLGARSEQFNVFIQSGAVLAVIAVFRERVRELFTQWQKPETQEYLKKMGTAFLITAIGGLSLKKAGWELDNAREPIAWALLIGGILFIVVEKYQEKKETPKEEEGLPHITWILAVGFGVAQLIAMVFPGASRSGTTILMALVLGMQRKEAVEFSFLLGVPTLLAAGAYQMVSALKENAAAVQAEAPMLSLGTVVSAITAFIAVKWMLSYLQKNNFIIFGWYRIILGLLMLGFAATE
jgi:undecaprenyl-diphosphatase